MTSLHVGVGVQGLLNTSVSVLYMVYVVSVLEMVYVFSVQEMVCAVSCRRWCVAVSCRRWCMLSAAGDGVCCLHAKDCALVLWSAVRDLLVCCRISQISLAVLFHVLMNLMVVVCACAFLCVRSQRG